MLGTPDDYDGFSTYPYTAISLTEKNTKITFNSFDCVKEEMVRLVNKTEKESNACIGQVLYMSIPFFANLSSFLSQSSQLLIKKFQYCKLTNTPPYQTLDQTPATIVDNFMVIDSEINSINKELREENNGN